MTSPPVSSKVPNLDSLMDAITEAGEKIREVYDTDFEVIKKDDNSPITKADLESNKILRSALEKTGIPILSEEDEDDKSLEEVYPSSTRRQKAKKSLPWTVEEFENEEDAWDKASKELSSKKNKETTTPLIMKDIHCVIFVEVRYRKNTHYGHPITTVDQHKQKRLSLTAFDFLQKYGQNEEIFFELTFHPAKIWVQRIKFSHISLYMSVFSR